MQTEASARDGVHDRRHPVMVWGAWLLLVAVGVASCTPQRPSREEWRESWQSVQDVVPPEEDLPRPPDHETCSDILADLRERAAELSPAPDQIVHDAAQAWISHAESLFFDCFDEGEPERQIEEGYATLERLSGEVEAALSGSDG